MDLTEVGKVCLTAILLRRILHVDALTHTHFTKYQLPDKPIFGAGVVFCDAAISVRSLAIIIQIQTRHWLSVCIKSASSV